MTTTAGSPSLVAVSANRAPQIARDIGDWIVERGWPVGQVLGSESDLCERYNVSRAVFREAVRLVEHHTIASMRRGPGGGLVIREPDTSAVLKAVLVYLESVEVTVEDIFETRLILEPLAARWAAVRSGAAAHEALCAALDHEQVIKAREIASPNQELVHSSIASIAANPVIELFVDVLTELTAHYARTVPRITKKELLQASDGVASAHRAIVSAVIAKDPDSAAERCEKHLVAMAEWLTSKYGGASTAKQARLRASRRAEPPREPGAKLAEHIADCIRDDMSRRGIAVGELVGSEVELIEQYGISRAAFREAARLLEHHSVGRMRRGRGGGLVRTLPEPTAGVESMALLLDFRQVKLDHVIDVRNELERACISRLAGRVSDPDTRAQLESYYAQQGSEGSAVEPDTALPEFHAYVADLAGNPLLSLFVQILVRLGRRHFDRPEVDARQAVDASNAAHRSIARAVLRGDAAQAERRMLRHLGALDEWWND